MASFTPRLTKLLRRPGCALVHPSRDDHGLWFGPVNNRRFVVDGSIPNRYLANAVLKQAGLPKLF